MPNPFSKTTEIRFTNPLRQNKTVMIYNSSGILVRSITTKNESVVWNGRNDVGLILPNGCYFVRLDKSPAKSIQKIIIAR
jgi:flagellar hook assembly protein FlgD